MSKQPFVNTNGVLKLACLAMCSAIASARLIILSLAFLIFMAFENVPGGAYIGMLL